LRGERSQIVPPILANPQRWKADALAWRLRLTRKERTMLGITTIGAVDDPTLVRAFGINVPRMITLTYGLGVGLAALARVLSAPINQVRPLMGADLIIVV
jgi:branched-subunit amino acid ABC-type transport system permease component